MKYAVLFRGMNVGGKNVVKMAALTDMLGGLGLCKIKTYIQSGNAVFETEEEQAGLKEKIEAGFLAHFGFTSSALVRSEREVEAVITGLPFTDAQIQAAEEADPAVAHLYVYFLPGLPDRARLAALPPAPEAGDMLRLGEAGEAYFLCGQSIRNSKLAGWADKAFPGATVRNWQTVVKLADMLHNL